MTKKRWILFCVTTAVLLLVCIIVALSGCADSSTKGNVKEIEAPVTATNGRQVDGHCLSGW